MKVGDGNNKFFQKFSSYWISNTPLSLANFKNIAVLLKKVKLTTNNH